MMLWLLCFPLLVQASPLEVFIIPHSHCDAGYRETFLGYYRDKVKHTINTVVDALTADVAKRFVWEEVSFLELWWEENSPQRRDMLRALIDNQQLELIGGGYVMHDEADSTLAAQANQLGRGLSWLEANLGRRPKVAWQIDPFGHSSTTAILHAMLGYDALVLNRVADEVKDQMKAAQELEFNWKGSSLLEYSLMTHVLDSHYHTPIIAGVTVPKQAESLVNTFAARRQWFQYPKLLVAFGGDFQFTNASQQFATMDPVLAEINSREDGQFAGVTVHYGTLSEYFDSLTGQPLPNKTNVDFFPYIACTCGDPKCDADGASVPCGSDDAWWTGYFSVKPAQKLLSSAADSSLRTAEMLFALRMLAAPAGGSDSWWNDITMAREQSALYTHHDAIAGTSFIDCTISETECDCYGDYSSRLNKALKATDDVISEISAFVLARPGAHAQTLSTDIASQLTQLTDATGVMPVVVVNSLGWARDDAVVVGPVSGQIMQPKCLVVHADGVMMMSQVVYDSVRNVSSLYVQMHVDALSVTTMLVSRTPDCPSSTSSSVTPGTAIDLSNGLVTLSFDGMGRLQSLQHPTAGQVKLQKCFRYYPERLPDDSGSKINIFTGSNVYDMTPSEAPTCVEQPVVPLVVTAQGPFVWELTQVVSPYINLTFRLFKDSASIQVQPQIGVLPKRTGSLSLWFSSDISAGNAFSTMTNSYQSMTRQYNASRPVQGNLYPTTARLSIHDQDKQLSWLVGRSVGATAVNGELELFLARRLIDVHDSRGDDTEATDDIMLLIADTHKPQEVDYQAAMSLANPLSVRAASVGSADDWVANVKGNVTFAKQPLPPSVHLLDLKARSNATQSNLGVRLLRTEGDPSSPVTVDFDGFLLTAPQLLEETTLDYNMPLRVPKSVDLPTRGSLRAFTFNVLI